jgi:hypothetical protein
MGTSLLEERKNKFLLNIDMTKHLYFYTFLEGTVNLYVQILSVEVVTL